MNFSVNQFFNKDECEYFIKFAMENGEEFKYDPKEHWDCRRVYDNDFKNRIYSIFKKLYSENKIKFWFDFEKFNVKNINVSLTRYYDGRFLEFHHDSTSEFTTVIVLSEGFDDGRFVLSEDYISIDEQLKGNLPKMIDLKLGEGVSFNGGEIYHGVMPVTNGIRCALNVWMTDTDFDFYKLKKENTLI